MHESDSNVEVCPQPVDERHRHRDLGDEQQCRPAGVECRDDRLDVDRRLARPGHAVEQERARVAAGDRAPDALDGVRLGRGSGRSRAAGHRGVPPVGSRAAVAAARGPLLQRDRAERARPPRRSRTGPPGLPPASSPDGFGRQRLEDRPLLRSERPARQRPASLEGLGGHATGLGQPRPIVRIAVRRRRPAASTRVRSRRPRRAPAGGATTPPDRLGLPGLGPAEVRISSCASRSASTGSATPTGLPGRSGRAFCHQLQPLQEPGWKHRPDDEGRWREVVRCDLAGERQTERRQERTVSANAFDDRPRRDAGRRFCLREDRRRAPVGVRTRRGRPRRRPGRRAREGRDR